MGGEQIVPPPAMCENARENPRFSRTLGFTIQLDTVLDREGKRERTKLKCGDKSLRIPSFPAFTNIIRDITCPCD